MKWILPVLLAISVLRGAEAPEGYYRFPALRGDTLIFTAEGDLWKVSVRGGVAQRLTTHLAEERDAAISPDGATVAFLASYEGSRELYTMPVAGGLPVRHSWNGQIMGIAGWTRSGEILYSTRKFATLPNNQLVALNPVTNQRRFLPLYQADQGSYDTTGKVLFFTRLPFQGSHAKRYKGGTAQNLWKYPGGEQEAVPLTADYPGTSKDAMWWKGRVYFLTDRDGTMNIWSMDENGKHLRQHTHHNGWDARSPSLDAGRIAYQLGADIHILDLRNGRDHLVPIRLASDFDQLRERWIDKPSKYLSAVHPSPDGDRVVLTARGELFVAPVREGRLIRLSRTQDVRYRDGRFLPDGKALLALSDESGEVEIWKLDAYGIAPSKQLTTDSKVLRWEAVPSPDGKWVAHHNKNQELWLLEIGTGINKKIAFSPAGDFQDLAWSPDSRWLAYCEPAGNEFIQVKLYNRVSGRTTILTSDRFNSVSPAWSPDGKWIYLLSDRHLVSRVRSPWGTRQPEPYFDKSYKIYHIPLRKDLRSPFQPPDELHPAKKDKDKKKKDNKTASANDSGKKADADKEKKPPPEVKIDLDGIENRLIEVPAPPGNYRSLSTGKKYLYWISLNDSGKRSLTRLEITGQGNKPDTIVSGIRGYELTLDGKKLMIRKGSDIYLIGADKKMPKEKKALAKMKVNLKGWGFPLDPREEIRQMFNEAWRLHRDYFWDPNMGGIDWAAMREKYRPLVGRVTDRNELNDLLAQMVSELSTMHTFVHGGDFRKGSDRAITASLGALLERDPAAGGYRVRHIYESDPDLPDQLSPLARPWVDIANGDIILAVNGIPTLSVPDIGKLLQNLAGKQTRLRVASGVSGKQRDVIVKPITPGQEKNLRYSEWEYSRRRLVEKLGGGDIGYVHLRAMGSTDISQWALQYYPIFKRKGLIIDVRHNRGGNIDSWILEKLLRKAWFYWQPRVGNPSWNMQYAFRGHMVVLCDEWTASDGEAFSEGFRRLGLGKVIGTRTWGGEIWLTASNVLVDKGIATAAELGVYGPEGEWLIEGHGVEPDITVDNLPHETFQGKDAQLRAALKYLQEKIRKEPVEIPPHPPYPDKSKKR